MPQYTYRCSSGHTFDAFCPMRARNESKICPHCGSKGERKGVEKTIDLDAHRGDPRAMSDSQLNAEGRIRKW